MLKNIFDKYIEAVLEKSPEKLASIFADNGVLKLPFRRGRENVRGRDNIFKHYREGFSQAPLLFTSIEKIRFHYSQDPDVAIVEYQLNGHTLPEQRSFYCLYINVISVKDGLVTELVDYEDVLNRQDVFTKE